MLATTALPFLLFSGVLLSQQPANRIETTGGTMTWELNPGALTPLDLQLDTRGLATSIFTPPRKARYATLVTHIAQTSGLTIATHEGRIDGIVGGMIELHDGPSFIVPGGNLDLRLARLKVEIPSTFALTINDRAGNVWATLDHPHYGLAEDRLSIWMSHFDLHLGPALAAKLGNSTWTGLVLGSVNLDLPIFRQYALANTSTPVTQCSIAWPSSTTNVDLEMVLLDHDPELGGMADSITVMRCGIPDLKKGEFKPCTQASTNGLVVLAPDAAVKNVGSAAVAWRPMFSAPGPPYNNDQHPYLIWNLYRIDRGGSIRQVGRSGVKHAYYADNFSCPCPAQFASYPQCEETYAAGTSDMPNALGPRNEILPATGQWGRCGSTFDPECRGSLDSRHGLGDDGYQNRLAVRESDLLPALHSGAKYVFEYGYVVRDNVNSEHAMAHRWVTPAKTIANNGIRWSITPTSFELGPAINAWVDPEHPERDSMNQRLTTVDGHVRIAVRTTILDGGRYRYDYAVMNEDFVRSTTTGQEPNLRIIASVGIDEIAIPVVRDGELSDLNSTGAGSPWTATTDNAVLAWRAQVGTSLEWGNMHTFSFTSSKKPQPGTILLRVAGTDNPSSYEVKTLTPSG